MALPQKAIDFITPVVVYGLGIVCPAIPSWVWSIIIKAVLSGDLTPAHFYAFLAANNLKTYYQPSDFPNSPPENITNIPNFTSGNPPT